MSLGSGLGRQDALALKLFQLFFKPQHRVQRVLQVKVKVGVGVRIKVRHHLQRVLQLLHLPLHRLLATASSVRAINVSLGFFGRITGGCEVFGDLHLGSAFNSERRGGEGVPGDENEREEPELGSRWWRGCGGGGSHHLDELVELDQTRTI